MEVCGRSLAGVDAACLVADVECEAYDLRGLAEVPRLTPASLVTLCRLKVEALALCGDITFGQLQLIARDYLSVLPRGVMCLFVQSLLAKSLSNLFPLRLLGRLHLAFPYALLCQVPLVCLEHPNKARMFTFPERTDGYYCSICSIISCPECLIRCHFCDVLLCANCGAKKWECEVPRTTEKEWEASRRPLPPEFDEVDLWTCMDCDPEMAFAWAYDAREEYEDELADDFWECARCGHTLEDDYYEGQVLREELERDQEKAFSTCAGCGDLVCERCVVECDECGRTLCPAEPQVSCLRCHNQNLCSDCLCVLNGEDVEEVCWSCYKDTQDCQKRLAAMVAFLDDSLPLGLRREVAAAITRHGGRVVSCLGPGVTHLVRSSAQQQDATAAENQPKSPAGGGWVVVPPPVVLSWCANLQR